MGPLKNYHLTVQWTGNKGSGTDSYRSYDRCHVIRIDGKADLPGSSDPHYRGDPTKYNPEELLIASLSSCHMLWYLHLCAEAGIIVVDYIDHAAGNMVESSDGGGYFKEVILNPVVTVANVGMVAKANELHQLANNRCFIANSINFKVHHRPICKYLMS